MIVKNHDEYEEPRENEDPDFKEFEDLVDISFPKNGPRSPISSAKVDKDFEPKDPGWPYPDQDWAFDAKR